MTLERSFALVFPGKVVENRHAGQDREDTERRVPEVIGKRIAEKNGGNGYKDRGNKWISPNMIRTRGIRGTFAEDENGAAGDHVKEPFGENREREKLAKTASAGQ